MNSAVQQSFRHPLSLSLSSFSLPSSSLDPLAWDQPMFLFVQARMAKQTTKGTLPFSRDLHKISILFDVREKYRRVTNTHARILSPLPFLLLLLPLLLPPRANDDLRPATIFLPVKPALLDLTNGTTKERNRYFHGSARFRACIPRSTHPPLPNRPCPAFQSALSQSRPSFCSIYLKLGFLPFYPSTLFSTPLSFPTIDS